MMLNKFNLLNCEARNIGPTDAMNINNNYDLIAICNKRAEEKINEY